MILVTAYNKVMQHVVRIQRISNRKRPYERVHTPSCLKLGTFSTGFPATKSP